MRTKLLLALMFGILLISSAIALDNLGTYKQNDVVRISQVCADASYINISSIALPNSTALYKNIIMTSAGSGEYYFTFLNTSLLGRYDVRGVSDGCEKTFAVYFDITPSGAVDLTDGQGNVLIIAIIIMLIIAIFFFILGYRAENLGAKIILIGTSAILLLATFLFSLVTLNQVIGGFSTILEGYTTFWFVVKIIFGIAITGLTLFVLWLSYQAFMIKRGFRD